MSYSEPSQRHMEAVEQMDLQLRSAGPGAQADDPQRIIRTLQAAIGGLYEDYEAQLAQRDAEIRELAGAAALWRKRHASVSIALFAAGLIIAVLSICTLAALSGGV